MPQSGLGQDLVFSHQDSHSSSLLSQCGGPPVARRGRAGTSKLPVTVASSREDDTTIFLLHSHTDPGEDRPGGPASSLMPPDSQNEPTATGFLMGLGLLGPCERLLDSLLRRMIYGSHIRGHTFLRFGDSFALALPFCCSGQPVSLVRHSDMIALSRQGVCFQRRVSDSDLDASSQYPSHGSLTAPATRPTVDTRGVA